MPRRAASDKRREIIVSLPASLLDRFEEQLLDPATNERSHGARSHVVRNLIYTWLEERDLQARKENTIYLPLLLSREDTESLLEHTFANHPLHHRITSLRDRF